MAQIFHATDWQARPNDLKLQCLSFFQWLVGNIPSTQDAKEAQILARHAGKGWCDATEREFAEAFYGRDRLGQRF